jgi:hypothetical protein
MSAPLLSAGIAASGMVDRYSNIACLQRRLNSTRKPYREAQKQAGLITDYKVFTARSKTPDEPNIIFMITYPNMAGLDRRAEEEALAEKMIGSAEVQNQARGSDYRRVLGSELVREIILQ